MPDRLADHRQEFVFELASQQLWFRAPEGRPSATPTVGIRDEHGSVVSTAADTNVTQDTVNTTLSASASAGDTSITLTAVTAVTVGRTYLLSNHESEQEWVTVRAINSSTKVVKLAQQLEHDYTTQVTTYGTFVSTLFYYTLQTADVGTLREMMQAEAVYAVSGAQVAPLRRFFDIVRVPMQNPLTRFTFQDPVTERWPDITRQETDEQSGLDYYPQRNAAWKSVMDSVRRYCTSDGRGRPALIASAEDLQEWALHEFALILQEGGIQVLRGVDPEAALTHWQTQKETLKRDALTNLRWFESHDDRGVDTDDDEHELEVNLVH